MTAMTPMVEKLCVASRAKDAPAWRRSRLTPTTEVPAIRVLRSRLQLPGDEAIGCQMQDPHVTRRRSRVPDPGDGRDQARGHCQSEPARQRKPVIHQATRQNNAQREADFRDASELRLVHHRRQHIGWSWTPRMRDRSWKQPRVVSRSRLKPPIWRDISRRREGFEREKSQRPDLPDRSQPQRPPPGKSSFRLLSQWRKNVLREDDQGTVDPRSEPVHWFARDLTDRPGT